MRRIHAFILFASILLPGTLLAEIRADRCLTIPVPRFYRYSLVSLDPIEAAILGSGLHPKEGESVAFRNGENGTWRVLMADSAGWFTHADLRDAYAALTLNIEQGGTWILEAMGHSFVYINGTVRGPAKYGIKDNYESWEPRFDFVALPVELKSGDNHFLFRCNRGRLKVRLVEPKSSVLLNTRDLTLPDLLDGEPVHGALVVINAGSNPESSLYIETSDRNGTTSTPLPPIPAMSVRKVGFTLQDRMTGDGRAVFRLRLLRDKTLLDTASVILDRRSQKDVHKRTFISGIDGSVQYYAVNPAQEKGPAALVLSVHGASVEAINQARSYGSKPWVHVVAPTNRRPYGFDWEDWGRLDALEVLDHASRTLAVDPERIYLTGHSMGGHGAWHLGTTYPDRFAAVGPSAGWIGFHTYAPRQSDEDSSEVTRLLMRGILPGDTEAMAENLAGLGVYILHGDQDESVPVDEARRMAARLSGFHRDFVYHEQAGASHWWDVSDEPGTDCVDWAPMFDFFSRHALPGERIRHIRFSTANPGISSKSGWLSVEAQEEPMVLSTAEILFDPGKARYTGSTMNVRRLSLSASIPAGIAQAIVDGDTLRDIRVSESGFVWLERSDRWRAVEKPSLMEKGPHRNGPFKDAFRNRMVFVYGTSGSVQENEWAYAKARYDAECFWYQGNGSVDIIPDTRFRAEEYRDRNVILYGNSKTNRAWRVLLWDCPVQVEPGRIQVGKQVFKGEDLACLFLYPKKESGTASVGAVSGSGLSGMKLTNTKPYLYSGWTYPDCIVFSSRTEHDPTQGILAAGYFGLDWKVETGRFVFRD